MNRTGVTLLALSVLSWLATRLGWSVPVLKLFDIPGETAGNALRVLAFFAGCWLVLRPARPANPLTAKRWKRFRSIRHRANLNAVTVEVARHRLAQPGLVVHEQHSERAVRGGRLRRRLLGPVLRPRVAGQDDDERGALSRLGLDGDPAAVIAHDAVADRQSQPGAHTFGLSGEKRIEHAVLDVGRNAVAAVFTLHAHLVPLRSLALGVHLREAELGAGVAGGRRLPVPLEGPAEVAFDLDTVVVHDGQELLCQRVALLRGERHPVVRLLVVATDEELMIARHTLALVRPTL